MKLEELPDDLRETIDSLKHGSYTIECGINDALENAQNLKDFKELASIALNNLIQEASDITSAFEHRQLTERERDRMIDIYASGPLSYIREIDDQLFLVDLLSFYDSTEETEAVVAKHDADHFFAKNGSVLPEWYGKEKEGISDTLPEMDEFREMAADIIDDVTEAIQHEYPDLKPKKEYVDESPDAAILYGEAYYNLEASIEDQLREKFILKPSEQIPSAPEWKGDLCIISHHGEPKVILEIKNARSLNIQSLLDEYLQTADHYFGDSDFIRYLQSRNIRVRNHPFDELTTGMGVVV